MVLSQQEEPCQLGGAHGGHAHDGDAVGMPQAQGGDVEEPRQQKAAAEDGRRRAGKEPPQQIQGRKHQGAGGDGQAQVVAPLGAPLGLLALLL